MVESKEKWAEGDRVEHRLFGFGTVVGQPQPRVGPDLRAKDGIRDAGYLVDVDWDAADREGSSVMDFALRKVSSPDARPFSFYDRQWQALRNNWLAARRQVENLRSTFRPAASPAELAHAVHTENEARRALDDFLRDEEDGKHP